MAKFKLKPWQEVGVKAALKAPGRRWLFGDEMGLGKTAQAITICKHSAYKRILVVCPAIVRSAWLREFDKWWPEHPRIGNVWAGPARATMSKKKRGELELAYTAPIIVTSYNLVHHVIDKGYDCIVQDECHRLINPAASWSKVLRNKVENAPELAVLGLTATPMPDKPLDAIGIIEAVWPGRMGGLDSRGNIKFKTKERYSNAEHNGYGWSFKGVNELFADELRARLSTMMSRTTKKEIAHLLPTFDVKVLTIPKSSKTKMQYAAEWSEDAAVGASHLCIMTDLRETAAKIAKKLEKSQERSVYLVTGALQPEQRNKVLAEAKNCRNAIIVATMHSVGIGIDLTFATSCLFIELAHRPEAVVQALGRFSRLSSTVPSAVEILVVEGSREERRAFRLQDKLEAIDKVAESGLSEQELLDKIGQDQDWEDMIVSSLHERREF